MELQYAATTGNSRDSRGLCPGGTRPNPGKSDRFFGKKAANLIC